MTDWTRAPTALTRVFKMASFPDAIAFATRLGFYAEGVDHHPDILISYRTITVTWSTHDAGGVTAKDEAGAVETDRLLKMFGGA
jgi:4a-hydroxytetrahydrobiopterin dehydratase